MQAQPTTTCLVASLLCSVALDIGCVLKENEKQPTEVRLAMNNHEKDRRQVMVDVPEIFELANVAIAISEEGLKHPTRVNKRGPYYERVLKHFLPFKDHALIREPDLHRNYTYFFRDNSVCYRFQGESIVLDGVYPPMRTPDLFGKHRALAEDFALVSGFRQFYGENRSYYREQIRRYEQKVPLRRMGTWLEERSPIRNHSYRIVFSPLLGSSHETCSVDVNGVRETFMFVRGPGEPGQADDPVGDALLAASVFTEIDHNYINPITADFASHVNEAFANLSRWSDADNIGSYPRPEHIFNEYMTWAVFLLYAHDTYHKQTSDVACKQVVCHMVKGRKFNRFGEFSEELLRLYRLQTPRQTLTDLYPAILAWAERQ